MSRLHKSPDGALRSDCVHIQKEFHCVEGSVQISSLSFLCLAVDGTVNSGVLSSYVQGVV